MRLVDRPHLVYIHHGADGDVLYIGVTSNTYARTLGHKYESSWWPRVHYIRTTEWMSRQDAGALEVLLINLHQPPNNRLVVSKSTFTMRAAS